MGGSINGGIPKWIVYFIENTTLKWMITRGTPISGNLYALCLERMLCLERIWLVVWNMAFIAPFSWEYHHPNWSELHHFSEGWLKHQPETIVKLEFITYNL